MGEARAKGSRRAHASRASERARKPTPRAKNEPRPPFKPTGAKEEKNRGRKAPKIILRVVLSFVTFQRPKGRNPGERPLLARSTRIIAVTLVVLSALAHLGHAAPDVPGSAIGSGGLSPDGPAVEGRLLINAQSVMPGEVVEEFRKVLSAHGLDYDKTCPSNNDHCPY